MRFTRHLLGALLAAPFPLLAGLNFTPPLPVVDPAGRIEIVSKPYTNSPHAFGDSSGIELSPDGRWAVFTSNGIFTPTDAQDPHLDVFLRDLTTGETIAVSRNADGLTGNNNSVATALSGEGRFVLFDSDADNLVAGDTNGASDVFLFDRTSGVVSLVSKAADGAVLPGNSTGLSITADGRFILFESDAANVVAGDANASPDLFLFDRESGAAKLVSANASNTGTAGWVATNSVLGFSAASVSEDGRFVTFVSSATNLVSPAIPKITQQPYHTYLRDMVSGTNTWLSRTATNLVLSSYAVISRDGHRVAFTGPEPTAPATRNLFIYDVPTAAMLSVVPHQPGTGYDSALDEVAISADGEHVAYIMGGQVYLYDVPDQSDRLISATTDGTPANSSVSDVSISKDGRIVTFTTASTNLVDGVAGDISQLYRWDRATGSIALLTPGPSGNGAESDILFPVLSADGSTAGFMSYASDLAPNDDPFANDVFVVNTSGTSPVQLASAPGAVAPSLSATGRSSIPLRALSTNGQFVAFSSLAPDIVPNDDNQASDVFLRDLKSGTTRLLSVAPDGVHSISGGASFALLSGIMSDDGSVVAFTVQNNRGSNTFTRAFYVADQRRGTNRLASILPDGSVASGLQSGVLSADGRYLAFTIPTQSQTVYLRDLEQETTKSFPVSRSEPLMISPHGEFLAASFGTAFTDTRTGVQKLFGNGSQVYSLSSNGKFLTTRRVGSNNLLEIYSASGATFETISSNFVSAFGINRDGSVIAFTERNPTNAAQQSLLILDRNNQTTSEVAAGLDSSLVVRASVPIQISDDGRYVVFVSTNSIVSTNDDGFGYIYRYDRQQTNLALISHSLSGGLPAFPASNPSISADASVIVFGSGAPDLAEGDRNQTIDIFAYVESTSQTGGDENHNGIDDAWEIAHFGQANVDPAADADSDGATNLQEFLAGTDPRDPQSALRLAAIQSGAPALQWFGLTGKIYQLQFRASLTEGSWQNFGNPVTGQNQNQQIPADPTTAAGFYRLVLLP